MSDHEPLAENPDRIWLEPQCATEDRHWCQDPKPCDDCDLPPIEYIRADLAAAPDLLSALIKLSNEVLGSLPLMEPLARRELGNANYNILIQRAEEARAAIAKAALPPSTQFPCPPATASGQPAPEQPLSPSRLPGAGGLGEVNDE